MEVLFQSLAESSPVAVVSLFAIWRISVVMVALADALVLISKMAAEQPKEIMKYEKAYGELQQKN